MAQAETQPDFDSMLQTFLVDLDGDGVPDAQMQAPAQTQLPPPPAFPTETYGPKRSEFNAPLFSSPDEGDLFTLRHGEQRIGGIPNSLPSMDEIKGGAKNALMGGLEFAAGVGGATGGPPGAIIGNAARIVRNLPAVAGDMGERVGRLFAGGRDAVGRAGDELTSALTAPGEAAKGFNRGNSDLMAAFGRQGQSLDDGMGEAAAYAQNWQSTAYPPSMPPSRQITQGPSAPDGAILSYGQKHELAGRRPQPDAFVKQGQGYVAESAEPYMANARNRSVSRDELLTDLRMGRWNDARTSRRVQEVIEARRPEAMADAVVNVYMPQPGFRDAFARDPMRAINDLETSTGVSRLNLISAMERAGFDLSFMTRDKFMSREGGRMSGYYAPGGREAFQQVQESPVLYRQRSMPAGVRDPNVN
jgi:hypothetical protein